MNDETISPLRRRMIEDMTVRGIGAKTRHDYVRHIRTFTAFIGRSPDMATAEEVRRFQLHQTETGIGAPSINSTVSALRFLFAVTLDRPDLARRLTVVREARKLPLVAADAFAAFLVPLQTTRWVVYCKRPLAGPQAVLAYLARYTHRVAIANSRLIAADADGVTFTWKDYRFEGRERYKTMTLAPHEFIRRFLLHVLPKGFHRIRHYGLFASTARKANIVRARLLLAAPPTALDATTKVDGTAAGA